MRVDIQGIPHSVLDRRRAMLDVEFLEKNSGKDRPLIRGATPIEERGKKTGTNADVLNDSGLINDVWVFLRKARRESPHFWEGDPLEPRMKRQLPIRLDVIGTVLGYPESRVLADFDHMLPQLGLARQGRLVTFANYQYNLFTDYIMQPLALKLQEQWDLGMPSADDLAKGFMQMLEGAKKKAMERHGMQYTPPDISNVLEECTSCGARYETTRIVHEGRYLLACHQCGDISEQGPHVS